MSESEPLLSKPAPSTTSAPITLDLAYQNEIWRKLLHLFALVIPIGYYLAPHSLAIGVCLGAFVISLVIDIARIRKWPVQRFWVRWTAPIVRPKEQSGFTGATNILASAWLCPVLFTQPAAALGMTVIILGDTAAALVGRRWGRHRIRTGRTVEGSLAFLVAAVAGGMMVPGIRAQIAIPAALIATVVEAVTQRIDDNLSVPIIVALFTDITLRTL